LERKTRSLRTDPLLLLRRQRNLLVLVWQSPDLLLSGFPADHQPWELQQLNVVQRYFLEDHKLTGSSLPVWSPSRVFVGLNKRVYWSHFPLLSAGVCLEKNDGTPFELLH
jgi:hypothetical protein